MPIMTSDCKKLIEMYKELESKARGKTASETYHQIARELEKVLEGKQTFGWLYMLYADLRFGENNRIKQKIYAQVFEDFKKVWKD